MHFKLLIMYFRPIIILQGHLSDRYGKRHLHIEIAASFALVSYILLVVVNHGHVPVALLFACMYMVVPILGTVPIMMAWNNEIHQDDAGKEMCNAFTHILMG